MPATRSSASRAAPRARSRKTDAISLLKADHQLVSELFEQFEKLRSPNRKKALVAQICRELSVHAQIEEEIFYPAMRAALRKDRELVPEALVEHESIKQFIAQLDGREPDGEDYDARVTVMGEYVKHHVKEEQTEMFRLAKESRVDLQALGEQLLERKQALMAEA